FHLCAPGSPRGDRRGVPRLPKRASWPEDSGPGQATIRGRTRTSGKKRHRARPGRADGRGGEGASHAPGPQLHNGCDRISDPWRGRESRVPAVFNVLTLPDVFGTPVGKSFLTI